MEFTSKSPFVIWLTVIAMRLTPGKLTSNNCFVPSIGATKYILLASLLHIKLSTVPSHCAVKFMFIPLKLTIKSFLSASKPSLFICNHVKFPVGENCGATS